VGYETVADLHRASDFGVPQERPRYLIVGLNRAEFQGIADSRLPQYVQQAIDLATQGMLKQKGLDGKSVIGVREALSDLRTRGETLEACSDAPRRQQLRYVEPETLTPYQACMRKNAPLSMNSMRLAKHSTKVAKRFAVLINDCKAKGRRGITLRPNEFQKTLKTKKHAVVVLDPRKPSHTLTTLPDDLIHYDEPRILTVREYARLQSFPDWFAFEGKYTTGGELRRKECPRYTQVGNAVAPFVAEAFGRALLELDHLNDQKRLHPRAIELQR
jgi:DNA (cytosine-5)-methyltransferase 1